MIFGDDTIITFEQTSQAWTEENRICPHRKTNRDPVGFHVLNELQDRVLIQQTWPQGQLHVFPQDRLQVRGEIKNVPATIIDKLEVLAGSYQLDQLKCGTLPSYCVCHMEMADAKINIGNNLCNCI